mgnify:CR=1 FL=1
MQPQAGRTGAAIAGEAEVGGARQQVGHEQRLVRLDVGVGQDIDALADFGNRQGLSGDGDDDFSRGLVGMGETRQGQQGGGEDKGGFAMTHVAVFQSETKVVKCA